MKQLKNITDYDILVGYAAQDGKFFLDGGATSTLPVKILGYELVEPMGIKVLLSVYGKKCLLASKSYTVRASFLNHPDEPDYDPNFGLGILHTSTECVIAPTKEPITIYNYEVYPLVVLSNED